MLLEILFVLNKNRKETKTCTDIARELHLPEESIKELLLKGQNLDPRPWVSESEDQWTMAEAGEDAIDRKDKERIEKWEKELGVEGFGINGLKRRFA